MNYLYPETVQGDHWKQKLGAERDIRATGKYLKVYHIRQTNKLKS